MITKGIIEQVISKYCVKVRMPQYDKIKGDATGTKTNDLYSAYFCTLPNCFCNPKVNDVVYVGFEDNDQGKPIILGYLCRSAEYGTYPDLKLDEVRVVSNATLPSHTTIGNLSPTELSYVKDAKSNLQGQITVNADEIAKLKARCDELEHTIADIQLKLK